MSDRDAWADHRQSCEHCIGHPFSPCKDGEVAQTIALAALTLDLELKSQALSAIRKLLPDPRTYCPSKRDQRQRDIVQWTIETFGEHTLAIDERASRFIEEAAELVQATGLPIERLIAIAQHVYAKPRGDVPQEIGAVGLTLLALAEVTHVSADDAETAEMRRVFAIPKEHFRRRHNAKADAGLAVRVPEKK